MMVARKERPVPDRSAKEYRPVEFVTENGFCIVRLWEVNIDAPPDSGEYSFVVRNPDGLERVREVVVEIADGAVAQIEKTTHGRITLGSTFWIYCAELHLADYLWEHDDYPPTGRLSVDHLSPADVALAIRWETT